MATSAKAACIHLKLNSIQKARFEEAAELSGQTLSQWSLERLDQASSWELSVARALRISDREFEKLLEFLEQPMASQTQKLIEEANLGWG